MKVYNPQSSMALRPALILTLEYLRECSGFNPVDYCMKKAERLNAYLTQSRLKSCVVAVSGGIDSAVVLGIVHQASLLPNSPIQKIVPVLLPVFDENAATNQETALQKGRAVAHAFGLTPIAVNLSTAHHVLKSSIDQALGEAGEGWASGQLVSYLRTPALYYVTSLLNQMNLPGVLVGTTNKDEGAYLGYFGKASDGLTDVQLISDLHKSEVFTAGRHLGVPESIMEAVPTGDMYDGRVDEEVFGAPYDFVELFLQFKSLDEGFLEEVTEHWTDADWGQFEVLASRLEALHSYNGHKYMGKSPAVHLDIRESRIPGGWDYYVYEGGR